MAQALQMVMTGTVNVLAKYAGAAALRDTDSQAKVRAITLELRRKTTAELERRGFAVIPSETNFFMVHVKRPVRPVIDAFKAQGVLVGRPFAPMLDYLRVSVGAPEEMQRFLAAWDGVMA
jgi:histidinol-phosphate/aromatic aminotransferase/cobyric acid decarboxylase-like protein